jgi:hypothetical protein
MVQIVCQRWKVNLGYINLLGDLLSSNSDDAALELNVKAGPESIYLWIGEYLAGSYRGWDWMGATDPVIGTARPGIRYSEAEWRGQWTTT